MNLDFLDFEQPIAELEAKINELRHMGNGTPVNLAEEIKRLEAKVSQLTEKIFSGLSTAQKVQLARHAGRPHTMDYLDALFTDVDFLEGDRHFACSDAMVGALARFEGQPVMVLGHEKGRSTKEKVKYNFGMPRPEGYRKALRLMQLAEKFALPVFTFIDTPGAHAGVTAEAHNQSEAIARNLFEMARLKSPIVATVIGEGGSGGALAIGVADRVGMLEHAIYSVISPEGCASILWKSAANAGQAAEAMGVTAQHLLPLGLIDEIIAEPLGGAHRDMDAAASAMRDWLKQSLAVTASLSLDDLVAQRQSRYLGVGNGSTV